jgi:hypothetical protein
MSKPKGGDAFTAITRRIQAEAKGTGKRRRAMPTSPLDRSPLDRIGVLPASTKVAVPEMREPEPTVTGGQRAKVRRTVWLTPELDARLARYAAEQERDLSWVVRKALESMLP